MTSYHMKDLSAPPLPKYSFLPYVYIKNNVSDKLPLSEYDLIMIISKYCSTPFLFQTGLHISEVIR